jgi:hypothetical protein
MKLIIVFSLLFTSLLFCQNNKLDNYKYGFINIKTGQEIAPLKYDETKEFNKGFASVRIDDKWGVINCAGIEVVELKCQYIGECIELNKTVVLPVIIDNKWVIFDKNGALFTPMKFDNISRLSVNDNFFGLAVKLKDKWGVVDHIGKLIIPIRYQLYK